MEFNPKVVLIKVSFRHITVCVLLLFFVVQDFYAQRYTTRLINSTQGLSNNEINDIFQDSRSFLWFATEDGLNRYDGYEYVVFRKDVRDSLSIGSNYIHCLTEDNDHNIWIGTDKGISKLDAKTGEFKNFVFTNPQIGVWPNETFDLVFDQQGSLWCLMSDRIIQYWPEKNNFSEFPIAEKYHLDRNDLTGYLAYHRKTGTIYIGTGNGLLYIKENFREVRETTVRGDKIYDIFICKHDNIWIATSNGYRQCNKGLERKLSSVCEYKMKGKEIKGIMHDYDDNLILLSEDNIMLVDEQTGELISESFLNIPGYENFPLIRSSLVDKTMNLWIGTQKGVCYTDLNPLKFEYYNSDVNRDVPIHQNLISSVCADDENIYVGSWLGGLEIINKETQETRYYSKDNFSLYYPERNVQKIFIDSESRIWVFGEKMYRFYPKEGEFVPVEKELNFPELAEINGTRIFDIIEKGKDEFVISHMGGMYYFNRNKRAFFNDSILTCDTLELPLHRIQKIEESQDYYWFAAYSGVLRKSKETQKFDFFPSDSDNGLSGKIVTVYVDSKDRLWVGSPEGLYLYSATDSSFSAYNVQDGFSNDFIYSIEEDNLGRLWMGTNKGIINFNPETGEVRNFGVQHGLSAMEFNLGASHRSRDGKMYFGSIEGLNFFDPGNMFFVEDTPQSVISAIRLFSRDAQIFDPFPDPVQKISDKESIQIFFSAMDHSISRYNKYKYSLTSSGSNSSWHDIGTENSIILSGLDHGKYTLKVIGANSEGAWCHNPASLTIVVNAPIYRRKSFILVVAISLFIIVLLFLYIRTNNLRKSNKVLREKENVAKQVMQQQNMLSRRNKNIEDSLKYAQRIQYAMFTSATEIKKMIPESFVLQKPKDIVSGDFYWAKKIGSKVFIAAADCTGHGVPGAFMSLIGIEFFRQIVGVQRVYKPSLILDEINRNFDLVFGNETDIDLRDGMDLAFIVIDTDTNMVQFSGAVNPLYIVRDGELIEIKGDRIVLGPDLGFGKDHFNNHEIQLEENDMLYVFSDGYVDQFGGPEGKKFKFRRFRHLLMSVADQPVEVQQLVLENSMKDWIGNHEQVDDILVMGFRPYIKFVELNDSPNTKSNKSTSREEGLSSGQGHQPEKVY